MQEPLLALAPSDLRALVSALRTGRLCLPYRPASVQRMLNGAVASEVSAGLQELADSGMPATAIARTLELLAAACESRPPLEDVIDLVTTGPEVRSVTNRDTSVVVRELFHRAEESVLVAGYAVYQGQRVFQALADRMLERSNLKVRMFLEIQRKQGDTSAASELIGRFTHRFRTAQWPADRPLPEVYYDPRSLATDRKTCAALHAKVIVVDGFEVFVSSANFTEAAQERNIEVGLRLHSPVVAERISRFFESLADNGHFCRIL
jgi:phosphatidylserine/phosphatidylglycerophosphate/cardiolipin synthase-like enzyme